jgi:uncharacterized membrane protein
VGRLLQTGVIFAAVLVLAGGAVFLSRHGGEAPGHRTFRGEPAVLRSIAGIVHDAVHGSGRGIIQFGLLCLIATPVARVAFAMFAFLMQHDRLYAVVALIVLSLLLYSLTIGYL